MLAFDFLSTSSPTWNSGPSSLRIAAIHFFRACLRVGMLKNDNLFSVLLVVLLHNGTQQVIRGMTVFSTTYSGVRMNVHVFVRRSRVTCTLFLFLLGEPRFQSVTFEP